MGEKGGVPHGAYLEAFEILVDRAMPSEPQAVEWGVNAIKSPFKRLNTNLPADVYNRKRLLSIVCHLYNFRVRYIGLNQLRTVYGSVGDLLQPWVTELTKEFY